MQKIKNFYGVITPDAVGVFTTWDGAKAIAHRRTNKLKKFSRYHDAMVFIRSNLSAQDLAEFGLDRHQAAFDRIYRRWPTP